MSLRSEPEFKPPSLLILDSFDQLHSSQEFGSLHSLTPGLEEEVYPAEDSEIVIEESRPKEFQLSLPATCLFSPRTQSYHTPQDEIRLMGCVMSQDHEVNPRAEKEQPHPDTPAEDESLSIKAPPKHSKVRSGDRLTFEASDLDVENTSDWPREDTYTMTFTQATHNGSFGQSNGATIVLAGGSAGVSPVEVNTRAAQLRSKTASPHIGGYSSHSLDQGMDDRNSSRVWMPPSLQVTDPDSAYNLHHDRGESRTLTPVMGLSPNERGLAFALSSEDGGSVYSPSGVCPGPPPLEMPIDDSVNHDYYIGEGFGGAAIETPISALKKKRRQRPKMKRYSSEQVVFNTKEKDRRGGVAGPRQTLTFSRAPLSIDVDFREFIQSPRFSTRLSGIHDIPFDLIADDSEDEDATSKENLENLIMSNTILLDGLDQESKKEMVSRMIEMMVKKIVKKDTTLIQQGDTGDAMYIVEKGLFHMFVDEDDGSQRLIGEALAGTSFGEYALMYNTPRTATLVATEDSVVWCLSAEQFQTIREIISNWNVHRFNKRQNFLEGITLFANLQEHELLNLTHACWQVEYEPDTLIMSSSDSDVFIVQQGTVLTEHASGLITHTEVLDAGEVFGHRLWEQEETPITAARADSYVKILRVRRDDFVFIMAPRAKSNTIRGVSEVLKRELRTEFKNRLNAQLDDFTQLGVIGIGTFGKVFIARHSSTGQAYALKQVKKLKVVEYNQEQHMENERRVMATLDSPFCVKLFATFQTTESVYFLLELVLGGELFTLLRFNKKFSERSAMFYTACVVNAFEHMHTHDIIYRDLKPENLLLDRQGYLKITDFGFAKKRNATCTLCGTPEYLAPEVIHNWVQSYGVDWWALGVLLYEMIVGRPPFEDDEHVKMYEKILKYDPEFPQGISAETSDIICKLLEKNAYGRLGSSVGGARDVRNHRFFQHFDWGRLAQREMETPYIPFVDGEFDTSNYEEYPEEGFELDDGFSDDFSGPEFDWASDF